MQAHIIIKPVDEMEETVGIVELSGYERESKPLHLTDFSDCLSGDLTFCVVAKTNRYFEHTRYTGIYNKNPRRIIHDHFSPDSVVGYVVCKLRNRINTMRDRNEYVSVISFVVHPRFRGLGIAGDMFESLLSIIPLHLPISVSVFVNNIEACKLLKSAGFPPPKEVDICVSGVRVPYYMFTYSRSLYGEFV